jgi:hypothetical protein
LENICGGKSCTLQEFMNFLKDKKIVSDIDLETVKKMDIDANNLIDFYDI